MTANNVGGEQRREDNNNENIDDDESRHARKNAVEDDKDRDTNSDNQGSDEGDKSSSKTRQRKRRSGGGTRRSGAMAGPDGYYYYAEDVDQAQSELVFCWKVVAITMALVLIALTGAFVYQLYELWELSELSNEIKEEKTGGSSTGGSNILPVNKGKEVGEVGAKPFEISLPQECRVRRSALPTDNELCRMALARAVTPAMKSAYKYEGVIAIRGLLTPNQIAALDTSADELLRVETERKGGAQKARSRTGNQFYTDKSGALFLDPAEDNVNIIENDLSVGMCVAESDDGECLARSDKAVNGADDNTYPSSMVAFRHVALMSAVPLVAAELVGLDSAKNETLRVIKDIFLAKDEGEYVCGWHVDDHGFWPAQASSPGINAWISVDDIPPGPGGTFALAVGSHSAPWRMDAHKAIGSVMTYPEDGFTSAEDMVKNRAGEGTCNLKTAAPETNQKMEESKRIYDLRKGDVIFHERWLFHQTIPFDREVVHNHKIRQWGYKGGYEKEPPPPLMKRRYSIRYGPGSSVVIKGWGTEPSVLWNEDNAGKTADEVSKDDGPFYPKCWPGISRSEMAGIRDLVEKSFPVSEERKKERMKEMQMYLKEMKEADRKKRAAEHKER